MSDLKIGSFNCRGIASDAVKRRDIFNWIRQKNLDICVLLETHSTPGIHTSWKAEWGAPIWFSSYKSNSRGVAILFKNSFSYVLHNHFVDCNGRYIIFDIGVQDRRLSLVSLYGPNEDDPNFFNGIKQKLTDIGNQSIVMTGDWHVVLDYSTDCKNYVQRNNRKANEAVHDLINFFDLEDVWRVMNPSKRVYSWFGPNKKMGRLDYFLLSSDLAQLTTKTGYDTGYRSDHSLCYTHLSLQQQQRGRGTWKFNNSLLHDRNYVNLIKQTIQEVTDQYKMPNQNETDPSQVEFSINDQLFFEMLKLTIRGNTIPYSTRKKKERDNRENGLVKQLDEVQSKLMSNHQCPTLIQEKVRIETELEQIRTEKTKGIMVRTRAKWVKEGERCTKYFCNLEKRNYVDKAMQKITLNDGRTLTNTKDILNAQRDFYQNLYSTTNPRLTPETEKMFFDDNNPFINKLSNEEAEQCEGKLTLEECLKALKCMQNEKTPGSDGFTAEFFKFFWRDIGVFLLRSLNYAFENGELSITQRHGIITCLPKADKPRDQLKSWRPITLLNVDLKIGSAAVANRIKEHLNKLISENQKGYVKDRYIGECTRLIYDILYESKQENIPGLLLLIDFQKAFDSLEISFLLRALKYFGFKTDFIRWIEIFYTNISSSVTNNGHMSQCFNLTRGVRQGDPLSPYLFILAVECLSAALKFHPGINGVRIDGSEYLITQLADDTTLILDGSETSLENSLNVFRNFQECSGLQINMEKTQAIWIGSKQKSKEKLLEHCKLDWNYTGTFKLLGITYNIFDPCFTSQNYDLALQKIKNLLNNWKWRPLSPLGKITVCKNLGLSKLVHLFMALPNPPKSFFKKLETLFYQFIWNGGKDKIKRSVIIGKIEKGGLNMTHLESFCNAMKMTWIKKLHDDANLSSWKILLLSILEQYGSNYIWQGNCFDHCKIIRRVNPFWRDILRIWSGMPRTEPTKGQEILSESLWYNKKILKQNNPIFYRHWFTKGIKYINDLIDDRGQFLMLPRLIEIHGFNFSFIEYNGLINSIPQDWKTTIRTYGKKLVNVSDNELLKKIVKEKKPSKYFYNILRDAVFDPPVRSQNKWAEEFPEIPQGNWIFYYTMAKLSTPETRIHFFQYKILHRILVTNSKLLYFGIKDNNRCTFCNQHKETISHLFCECIIVMNFWTEVTHWLNATFDINLALNHSVVIFGSEKLEKSVNCVILWAKYFIYCCRCKESKPDCQGYQGYLKKNVLVEKHALRDEQSWRQKWHNFLPGLGIT